MALGLLHFCAIPKTIRWCGSGTRTRTNKPFAELSEVFPNAACVVALIDRLVHHADIIPIKGESYRRKEAQERTTASRRKTPRAQP